MVNYLDRITWNDVDWTFSVYKVRTLQSRIFKASQNNDKQKAHWLQRLLLRNPHARLIAVHTVTTLNKGGKTPGINKQIIIDNKEKLKLAQNLKLNGRCEPIRRVWIPKPNGQKRPPGIPTIRERAKQCLCKLALEPYWEAKFEPNSYGFRPGRSTHDAIEAIYSNLHHNVDKWVFDADIQKCFDTINHEALLNKLEAPSIIQNQVRVWLKAKIIEEFSNRKKETIPNMGTPQGGVISPLLANIALHGLEEHLLNYVSQRKIPKPHNNAARGRRTKRAALGIIRYADDFVLIHRDKSTLKLVITECEKWLSMAGLKLSLEKCQLKLASQSFRFLGFQITYLQPQQRSKGKVLITPSKKNIINLITKTREIIQSNKSASSYNLIGILRPVLIGWANYFQYCECKNTFSKIDNIIYQQLRAWVLRRSIRQSRENTMKTYFPSGQTYIFQNRKYSTNWVFTGKSKESEKHTRMLPKISWIPSKKFVKVQGTRSIYDNDQIYWTLRNARYSLYSYRKSKLLKIQKGICPICQKKFTIGNIMEVDHILPKRKGGKDTYQNLQLIHRHCHVLKTKQDLK